MPDLTPSSVQAQFEAAIADLWWMSETDAPFLFAPLPDAFVDGFSISELLRITEHELDSPYEEANLEDFFRPALKTQDWHGEDEKEDIRRFQALKDLVQATLTDVHVVRVGAVNIDIYIVGKTEHEQWVSLSTQAVET